MPALCRLRTGVAALLMLSSASLLSLCQNAGSDHPTGSPKKIGEAHFISLGDLRLQYVDWGGKGETLIFIPGGCDTAFVFADAASRLAKHFRVLGLTARGCGASDRPASGYDMSHQIGDILGFMDALKIQKCVLIGHSSGAGKITQFAHKYPERVDRLIYLDTVYAYVAPGLEEKIDAQIEKTLNGHPTDSFENWQKAEKIWELDARSTALDRNFREIFSVGPDGKGETAVCVAARMA